jgi:OmpA-OmpF porin, OOP family
MKIPLWLAGILFLGWTAWVVNHYFCVKCGCCGAPVADAGAKTSGVPLFRWNADKPDADANFKTFKKDLLKRGGQGDTLVITGHYRSGETGGEKLGLARAAAIKAMMSPEMPDNRVKLAAKLVSDALSASSDPMESAGFAWNKMILKMEESAIIETDNSTIILFPFNSTEKDKNPKVDAFLNSLCDKHKGDNSTITVVGHTDNVGEDKENEALGLGRAKSVTRILESCGIAAGRITTSSKGESEPAADNNSDDGRHQNRRVVITVNK